MTLCNSQLNLLHGMLMRTKKEEGSMNLPAVLNPLEEGWVTNVIVTEIRLKTQYSMTSKRENKK